MKKRIFWRFLRIFVLIAFLIISAIYYFHTKKLNSCCEKSIFLTSELGTNLGISLVLYEKGYLDEAYTKLSDLEITIIKIEELAKDCGSSEEDAQVTELFKEGIVNLKTSIKFFKEGNEASAEIYREEANEKFNEAIAISSLKSPF